MSKLFRELKQLSVILEISQVYEFTVTYTSFRCHFPQYDYQTSSIHNCIGGPAAWINIYSSNISLRASYPIPLTDCTHSKFLCLGEFKGQVQGLG